jgi:hypothetical protein
MRHATAGRRLCRRSSGPRTRSRPIPACRTPRSPRRQGSASRPFVGQGIQVRHMTQLTMPKGEPFDDQNDRALPTRPDQLENKLAEFISSHHPFFPSRVAEIAARHCVEFVDGQFVIIVFQSVIVIHDIPLFDLGGAIPSVRCRDSRCAFNGYVIGVTLGDCREPDAKRPFGQSQTQRASRDLDRQSAQGIGRGT